MKKILAVGGLKYAPAALVNGTLLNDSVCGELDDAQVLARLDAFRARLTADGWQADLIACDLHDGYAGTQWALAQGLPLRRVQHHRAHALAGLWPDLHRPALALTFDGTGLGDDGTLWGGEFLAMAGGAAERVAALEEMPLLGGEAAIREPVRLLAGYLTVLRLPLPEGLAIPGDLRDNLPRLLAARVNTPRTSSVGRLFDAVAAFLKCEPAIWSEGGAARALQALAECAAGTCDLPVGWDEAVRPRRLRLKPLLAALLAEKAAGRAPAAMAYGFHDWLARAAAEQSRTILAERALDRVVLGGGVWHNALLVARYRAALGRSAEVILPPPELRDDRGLATGQLAAIMGE